MIRMLSLAAALAVLPLSAAFAEDPQTPSEAAVEAAATAFEARMESFGARAEAIQADKALSDAQREARVATLWSEYQPEVAVFTAAISEHAGKIAQEALADIDVDALVQDAMNSPDVQAAMVGAQGMASNGAWAQDDPEQQVTYGLMAQYGLDQAMDGMDEAEKGATADAAQAVAEGAKAEAEAAALTDH